MTNYEYGYIDGAKDERKRIEKELKALSEDNISMTLISDIIAGRRKA